MKNKTIKNKIFKYESICHSLGAIMYSTKSFVIGDKYDVYFASYAFSDEYEIFKEGEYYTSFILHIDLETDETFTKYFHNKSQMISINREQRFNEIGI